MQSILDAGGTPLQEIKDVGKGKLISSASDKDCIIIGLIQEP